ncbi:MAG: hypothetical protein HY820_34535 [Acidobacteria bacterium]|nr:hypothetical protein [Acidobacteriota bacterium]
MQNTLTNMSGWVPVKDAVAFHRPGAKTLGAVGAFGFAVLGISLWLFPGRQEFAAVAALPADPTGFELYLEYFGSRAYTNPEIARDFLAGMGNAVTFTPPVDMAMLSYGQRVMLLMAATTGASGLPEAAIEQQRATFDAIASPGGSFYWNLMPEWDQSGGPWVPQGRPRYIGLSRSEALQRFMDYYRNTYPRLAEYLAQPAGLRKYKLAALTDYSSNVHYGYDFGAELQMLERGSDELGDVVTGVAFIRGAGRQYGRRWGIDLSSWRSTTAGATTYTDSGVLTGGWSASYLRRHLYWAYVAGTNIVHMEAVLYRKSNGDLNPLGSALQDFGNFALRRHTDVGKPVVPAAILMNHEHGYDTKHGVFNQEDAVWYGDIAYNAGDSQVNNLLRTAYPDHWLHGLAPGASFANAAGVPNATAFRAFLSAGGDSRPFEPMPTTRWGDSFDVLTNHVPAAVLDQYKLIVLAGDVTLDLGLRNALDNWVARGGVLVMFGGQSAASDATLSGLVASEEESKVGTATEWLADGVVNEDEEPYPYMAVEVENAEVLAVTNHREPLVTRRRHGTGEVYVVTALFGQNVGRNSLVAAGVALMDQLMPRLVPAHVEGKPIQFAVNQGSGKIVATLINNTGREWVGTVVFNNSDPAVTVSEYVMDQPSPFTLQGTVTRVPVRVPAYDVRIYSLENTAR